MITCNLGHLVICSLHTLPALLAVALKVSEGTSLPDPQSIHLQIDFMYFY